ncbi:5'-methylthioadenosine/adenosylhomocysteine nucleosidase [Fusibacter paucivorans]|uniref:adenosylhomocysteine nucleosidase n=1 Tax=Fusibacter paucivorans TaxID=76009 RepID=A0ABS5PNL9_9FIRM|nr:5'-methylthioadenosine/adenosylhomocysteine nucleosidase [Fusibacter paucivorans]MBS7526668.1 5'-methylthioadenosine/adenosylhomocysteine nucleosidase [Fusibacter paucivorans]
MIGIIGAMDLETEKLKAEMAIDNVLEMAGMSFYAGKLKDVDVVVVTCGVGKVNAAVCTQVLINEFSVQSIINTGVSGALDERLRIGDIVISTDCMEHDFDVTVFGYELGIVPRQATSVYKADEKLIDVAYEAGMASVKGQQILKGRVVSGDQFISSQEKKQMLVDVFHAATTEMEGAAIAHTCVLNHRPFVIIRAISDQANGEAHVNFDEFAKDAAINSNHMVLFMLERLAV